MKKVLVGLFLLLPILAFCQDSLNIRSIGHIPGTGSMYFTVEVADDLCYSCCYHPSMCAYLRVADVSEPTSPFFIGFFEVCDGFFNNLSINENYAYVPDGYSVFIISLSVPDSIYMVCRFPTPYSSASVFCYENFCYIACHSAGLLVCDVADPSHPDSVGSFNTPDSVNDVFVRNNLAFLACDSSGLTILDVSDPVHIDSLGSCYTPGDGKAVYVEGNYAYIADGTAGLRIIDVSDSTLPFEIGYIYTEGYTRDVSISGNYAYLSNSSSGLRVIDISDPTDPIEVGFYETEDRISDAFIKDSLAYVAGGMDGLYILDISHFTSAIEEFTQVKPSEMVLSAFPNPFNSAVKISAPKGSVIQIFDLLGNSISTIAHGEKLWQPAQSVGSGIYFIMATVGEKWSQKKKVIYLK